MHMTSTKMSSYCTGYHDRHRKRAGKPRDNGEKVVTKDPRQLSVSGMDEMKAADIQTKKTTGVL